MPVLGASLIRKTRSPKNDAGGSPNTRSVTVSAHELPWIGWRILHAKKCDGPTVSRILPALSQGPFYVLKATDQWLPDEGPHGAIWSGGLGRIKVKQHFARYILDADGVVLRPPLPSGEGTSGGVGPRLYMVGEREEPDGPVKIGISQSSASRTGRGGMNVGNWRVLEVVHSEPTAFEDLRWTEWIIHKHLTGWRVRGEWFDVRIVAGPYGWKEFLSRSAAGDVPDRTPWQLGSDDHHLVRMRRLTPKPPRQFNAECTCGKVVVGDPGMVLPRVQVRFALEHLRLAPTDAAVMELTRRQ